MSEREREFCDFFFFIQVGNGSDLGIIPKELNCATFSTSCSFQLVSQVSTPLPFYLLTLLFQGEDVDTGFNPPAIPLLTLLFQGEDVDTGFNPPANPPANPEETANEDRSCEL